MPNAPTRFSAVQPDVLPRPEPGEVSASRLIPPNGPPPEPPRPDALASQNAMVLPGRRDLRWAYVALAVLGLGAYATLTALDAGPTWSRDTLYTLLEVLACVACLLRAVLVPARRVAWLAVGLGIAAWTAADLLFVLVYEPSGSIPYPSLGDALYLSFYVACFVALLDFARDRRVGTGFSLDALIGVLTVAAIWGMVLPSGVFDTSGSTAAVATNLLYPLGDLLLLALVATMLTKTRWRLGAAGWLFALALVIMSVADTIYLVQVAEGTYVSGTVTDTLWPASILVLGLVAWTPVAPAAVRARTPTAEYVFPAVCALLALAFLIWDHFDRAGLLPLAFASAVILASTLRGARLYLLSEHAAKSAEESLRRTVTALALTVDAKDAYTANHSQRVTLYALAIGVDLDLPGDVLERLCTAGELHDLGKLATPDRVLLKPGRLTAEEFEIMKQHSAAGERIVATAGMPDIGRIVRHHHERWDGRGYPDGIPATRIPLEARILAVADSLDAMTSDRSYSPSLTTEEAKDELARNMAIQFDGAMAASAVSLIERGIIRPGEEHPVAIDTLVAGRTDELWAQHAEGLRRGLAVVPPRSAAR